MALSACICGCIKTSLLPNLGERADITCKQQSHNYPFSGTHMRREYCNTFHLECVSSPPLCASRTSLNE